MRIRSSSRPPDDLAVFYAEQHDRVRNALALITGDRGLAEELTQEAFTKACQHWERVRKMDAPGAWVHRVAVNLAISRGRRRRTERRLGEKLRAQPRVEERGATSGVEEVDAVRTALLALPVDERAAVVLRFHADLSVAEVARVLDCPEGTVKTRTRRGLAALRDSGLVAPTWFGDPDPAGRTLDPGQLSPTERRPGARHEP